MLGVLRLNVICLVLILLAYGVAAEHHEVVSLNGGTQVSVGGAAMIDAATWEGFARSQDTLVTEKPPAGARAVTQKDCKT
jgi:hypothetical protein